MRKGLPWFYQIAALCTFGFVALPPGCLARPEHFSADTSLKRFPRLIRSPRTDPASSYTPNVRSGRIVSHSERSTNANETGALIYIIGRY
jgi:hypothetical protein